MRAPDWLTARPVAHRGLHDIARGIVENMPAAAQAAIDGNFSIECDIQLSRDGEAMVHHDNALGRLTEGTGALLGKTAAELKAVTFKNTPERMMTLGDLCSLVAGRVTLVIDVKSHFDGDRRLAEYSLLYEPAGVDFGYAASRYGEVRLGYSYAHYRADLEIGPREFTTGKLSEQGVSLLARYDRLDNPFFPRTGLKGMVEAFAGTQWGASAKCSSSCSSALSQRQVRHSCKPEQSLWRVG